MAHVLWPAPPACAPPRPGPPRHHTTPPGCALQAPTGPWWPPLSTTPPGSRALSRGPGAAPPSASPLRPRRQQRPPARLPPRRGFPRAAQRRVRRGQLFPAGVSWHPCWSPRAMTTMKCHFCPGAAALHSQFRASCAWVQASSPCTDVACLYLPLCSRALPCPQPCSRGGPSALPRKTTGPAHTLNVSTLQAAARANGSLRGSFYDPNASAADVAAAAASTAAAAAVKRALSGGAGSFRQGGSSFRKGGGSFRQAADGGSTAGADAEEEEVELLFSQGDGATDLDALFHGSGRSHADAPNGAAAPPSANGSAGRADARGEQERASDDVTADEAQQQLAASAGAAASQAAAALVRRQITQATASRAAAAGAGSTRDLLGRLQGSSGRQAGSCTPPCQAVGEAWSL